MYKVSVEDWIRDDIRRRGYSSNEYNKYFLSIGFQPWMYCLVNLDEGEFFSDDDLSYIQKFVKDVWNDYFFED